MHPGFMMFAHHDCCGMNTYVKCDVGCKIWSIIQPKKGRCKVSNDRLHSQFEAAVELSSEDKTLLEADVVTICLEEGDIMCI